MRCNFCFRLNKGLFLPRLSELGESLDDLALAVIGVGLSGGGKTYSTRDGNLLTTEGRRVGFFHPEGSILGGVYGVDDTFFPS